MNAYGSTSNHMGQGSNNAYGAMAGSNAAATSTTRTGDLGGLLQSGVSSSALVNSGQAALLGHNSFKLSGTGNASNLGGVSGGGPTNLGSTYGALGSGGSGLHHHQAP